MNFIADLHIHSRFSRATSKQLSPRHLAAWARCKGINVLGTGDFTHPQWRDELRQQLVRDEASGLYRLSGPAEELDFLQGKTPPDADGPLFLLQTEISSIYKRQGKVRKVHNLIFVPTLDDADRLSQRLELVGNLHSDGRPILGLDSRDLLEMTLDVCPEAVLIPAHVWTPWFALFGSKSGFDRLEDCFDDLSSHIFALETGLSSDPGMNRMVSQLDGYALISNSDAHSGANLGREANFFAGAPSYDGIFAALRAAARRLPPRLADAPKRGFPVPLADWLRQEKYYALVKAKLTGPAAERFFDTDALCALLDAHRAGKTNAMTKLWAFYCFIEWYEVYFTGKIPPDL